MLPLIMSRGPRASTKISIKLKPRGVELDFSYTFQFWQITPYAVGYYIVREFDYGESKTKKTGLPRLQDKSPVPSAAGR